MLTTSILPYDFCSALQLAIQFLAGTISTGIYIDVVFQFATSCSVCIFRLALRFSFQLEIEVVNRIVSRKPKHEFWNWYLFYMILRSLRHYFDLTVNSSFLTDSNAIIQGQKSNPYYIVFHWIFSVL